MGELCEINIGRTPARAEASYWGPGHPWLSISDMSQGLTISATKEQITDLGAKGGRLVEPGTVLLSFKLSIGKVGIANTRLYTNEAIAALPIKDPDVLDPQYLMRALQAMKLEAGSNRAAMGATLNKKALAQIDVTLPPLVEQRRIAAILDHADALRTKRRKVLAHLDSLTQAIFHDMFGDPAETSRNVEFGLVANFEGGRNLVATDSSAEGAYRVLKISAVTSGRFKPEESKPLPLDYVPPNRHLVRNDDLLLSRANTTELVGAVALVADPPQNLALPDKIWRIAWRVPAEPVFYHALLSTRSVRQRIGRLSSGTGGSMKNIPKAKLAKMPVPLVSLGGQRVFVGHAARIAAQRHRVTTASSADDELFASLQFRAFRGEL
nr:restriction endonuclease subunit S [Pseudactinotalea sp. HY160]